MLLLLVLLSVAVGCGRSGVDRISLRGKVSYNGQPVPAGQVRFEPDAKRGGSGPVGFATIVDGEYNTRRGGKGPTAGPVLVKVEGYATAKAFAPELFPRHTFKAEVSSDVNEIDFEVPAKRRGK
ncbi:MAG: hypothetical protein AAGJ46_00260 [Planctomycetota bacterium]